MAVTWSTSASPALGHLEVRRRRRGADRGPRPRPPGAPGGRRPRAGGSRSAVDQFGTRGRCAGRTGGRPAHRGECAGDRHLGRAGRPGPRRCEGLDHVLAGRTLQVGARDGPSRRQEVRELAGVRSCPPCPVSPFGCWCWGTAPSARGHPSTSCASLSGSSSPAPWTSRWCSSTTDRCSSRCGALAPVTVLPEWRLRGRRRYVTSIANRLGSPSAWPSGGGSGLLASPGQGTSARPTSSTSTPPEAPGPFGTCRSAPRSW